MQKRKTSFKLILIIVLVTLLLVSLVGCAKAAPEVTYSETRTFALDTLIDIKVYHYSNETLGDNILSDSVALVSTLENTLSSHIEGTEISQINDAAGISSVSVSDITYNTIKNSLEYSRMTGGLFDITAGPLISLWAIDPPNGHVPTEDELAAVLPLIGYDRIDLSNENMVGLADEGMSINLGAIAKGTISDQIKTQLVSEGVTSAIINLGGNVLMIGGKPDGSSFVIGVQDPADDRGAYLLSISTKDKAIVTSGDYERYFEEDGVRYHHILNPITGYPADTNIAQITIVAPTGEQADGLSTSVLLMGIEDGLALIETLEEVDAVLVTKDNLIYITDGLSDLVTIDETQSADYVYVSDVADLY